MDLKEFNSQQQKALLDLLVLGMYADGYLARAEDARVELLLRAMGCKYNYEYQREFDASVTRISHCNQTPEASLACATALAQQFSGPEQRKKVYSLLSDLMASDKPVSEKETRFLSVVRDVFHM